MIDPQTSVATIVLDHSECAAVFARHGIDYCCKGQRPLADACRDRDVPLDAMIRELELAVQRRTSDDRDPRGLSTRELITRVIGRHHRYLHRTLPFLGDLANKVARVHGDREPRLHDIARTVADLAQTLTAHLKDEEEVLFPALIEGRRDVAHQLREMRREHEEVGTMLATLRTAAADFTVPDWACNSYRTLLSELAELEADTLRHVHLENHVLLPRFLATA